MKRWRWVALALALAVLPASRAVRSLWMTRGGLSTFARLLSSANTQDLETVRSLCTRRYLESSPVEPSKGGGVVGLPRGIHMNFRAWVEGEDVWICPTDRVGPVYRLVLDGASWKFDGLVGLLGREGRVISPGQGDGVAPDFL